MPTSTHIVFVHHEQTTSTTTNAVVLGALTSGLKHKCYMILYKRITVVYDYVHWQMDIFQRCIAALKASPVLPFNTNKLVHYSLTAHGATLRQVGAKVPRDI